jgi:sugar O-acyltransferase (sialic acid O-acetyltransferase NeuD family)
MKKAIIGSGGMGRELLVQMLDNNPDEEIVFFVNDEYPYDNIKILPFSKFDPNVYEVVVAIGNSYDREKIINASPTNTKFFTFIHKSVQIFDKIEIGEGSIICAGSILTTNIKIGKHAQLNRATNISHDVIIGDFFTTAPGVHVSGNCKIGNHVYIGCLSCTKEKISICDDVIIGLNSGIIKNITKSGVYIGTPLVKIKNIN